MKKVEKEIKGVKKELKIHEKHDKKAMGKMKMHEKKK
jgi:hypothetical protein